MGANKVRQHKFHSSARSHYFVFVRNADVSLVASPASSGNI
jgi:hypothetical protein